MSESIPLAAEPALEPEGPGNALLPTVAVSSPSAEAAWPFWRGLRWWVPALPALRWWAFLPFAAIYLYSFPYFDRLRSANEMPRILVAQEVVESGKFYIDRRLGEMGSRQDLSRGPDGHQYQNKAPGPSLFAVPVYAVLKALGATSLRTCTWAFRAFVVTLPALLFLPFFYRLTSRFTDREAARRTALVAYAIGSPAIVYSMLFISHQLAAVAVGGSFYCAVQLARRQSRRPGLMAVLVGFFAGLAVMMDYQSVLALLPVGLYFLVRAPRKLVSWPLALAGLLPPAGLLGYYHQVCFGAPWKTGYSFAADPSTSQGFMGMVGFSQPAFEAVLVAPSNGLLVLVPWVVIAIAGAWSIFRRPELRSQAGWEAAVCLVVAIGYILFLGSLTIYMARGGWAIGPRYMTAALPFLAWLAAPGFAALDRWLATRVLGHTLVIAAAIIFLVAATTYPHWPDRMANPLHELSFKLLWKGYAVHSLGTVLDLRGWLAVAPLYLAATAFLVWLLAGWGRRRLVGVALACALAAGLVASYRRFPATGPYAEHVWGFVTRHWEPKP